MLGDPPATIDRATRWFRDGPRLPLYRSHDDRMFAGLAGGIAAALGIGSSWVRAAFAVLAAAGGAGLFVYLLGWAATVGTTSEAVSAAASPRKKMALGLMFLGLLLLLRGVGVWFDDAVTLSVALIAFGTASVWARSAPGSRAKGGFSSAPTRSRVVVGLFLLVGGIVGFFASVEALSDATPVVIAVSATAGGTLLLFGPWLWRMAGELTDERRERIRSQERAEISAHLHDSVLQTLALIQRSDDAKRMVTLARAQERELRSWLYGGPQSGPDGFRAALEDAAARVEGLYDLPVEVVVVGDTPLTGGLRAVIHAATEAANNAARHSGAQRISLFAEVLPSGIDVFVTDQGRGFDPAAVPKDRRGLTESIVARMKRHGGSATVSSAAGEGAEIHLHMPLEVHP
jgi:signal transduction histidine kinase